MLVLLSMPYIATNFHPQCILPRTGEGAANAVERIVGASPIFHDSESECRDGYAGSSYLTRYHSNKYCISRQSPDTIAVGRQDIDHAG
jgi:hypothetical protein